MEEVPAFTWGVVLIGPIVALGVALYASVKTDIAELRDNWVKYRCYPIYMPFASWINPDVSVQENFYTCLNMFGQAVMDAALDPIYSLFDVIHSILGDLMNSTNIFRTIFAKITNVILTVVGTVFGKIFNGMGAVLTMLGKVRDISHRITGSEWYVGFIAQTAIDMIMSVVNFTMTLIKIVVTLLFAISIILSLFYPPILAFAITLGAAVGITYCFDPDTPIELATGNPIAIKDVQIGDILSGGSVVEGVLRFKNHSKVSLHWLDGIVVSGYHKIFHDGKVLHVHEHPRAVPVNSGITELICLITNDHRIRIRGKSGDCYEFTDYEEDLDPDVMRQIELLTWGYSVDAPGLPGLSENTLVPLMGGSCKSIAELKIGDTLACGGIVDGIIRHNGECQSWVTLDDIAMTESQPILLDDYLVPILAKDETTAEERTHTGDAYSIVLRNSNGWFLVENPFGKHYVVRDYLETHDEETLVEIEDIVLESLNGKIAH
jgi:hypothetical protein